MADTHRGWQRGVIYQIYPRSFLDTDGDGIGDLRGIARGLAYLDWLGVDALWISPIYPSPMADFGYDISDHTAIDPRFGSLADFDAMIDETHRLGLRVIPVYTADRPETLRMVALMHGLVDRYPDRLLIGELYLPIAHEIIDVLRAASGTCG